MFWTKDAAKMPNLGILGVFLGGVLGVFPETGFFAGPKKEGGGITERIAGGRPKSVKFQEKCIPRGVLFLVQNRGFT